ncbi:MAG TPA: hypothetical protein DE015_12510, partial [Oceanospirillales bacterium]|nr:hypothetical protein [Oceanospirillales bacterium]
MSHEKLQVQTTCPYCGVGCGVDISGTQKDIAPVAGMKSHPANFGRLCVKGSALHDTLTHTDRLLHPTMNGQATDWDTALN